MNLATTLPTLTQNVTIPFQAIIKDNAGNPVTKTQADSSSSVTYDNAAPDLSSLALSVTGPGVASYDAKTYINLLSEDTNTYVWLNDGGASIVFTNLDSNFKSYKYTLSGLDGDSHLINPSLEFSSGPKITYGALKALSGYSESELTLLVRVFDQAGNYTDSSIGFTVDRTSPDVSGITGTNSSNPNEDQLVFTLSEDLQPGTIAAGVSIAGPGTAGAAIVYDSGTDTITVTAASGKEFTVGSTYALTFDSSVVDLAGNPMKEATYSGSFGSDGTITDDTTKPALTGVAGNDSGSPGTDTITLTLSEDILNVSTGFTITGENTGGANIDYDSDTHTITVTADSGKEFTLAKPYTFNFDSSIVDLAGNAMEKSLYGSAFAVGAMTLDSDPPTVTGIVGHDSSNTGEDTITLTLSEDIQNDANFTITGTDSTGAVIVYSSADDTITVTAGAGKAFFGSYNFSFSGVTDSHGLPMAQGSYTAVFADSTMTFSGINKSHKISDSLQSSSSISQPTRRTYHRDFADSYQQRATRTIRSEQPKKKSNTAVETKESQTIIQKPIIQTGFSASQTTSLAKPVKQREIVDLDTSDKELTQTMEQVDSNSKEYKKKLERLLTPELTRAQLSEMNDLLTPEIVKPETITVSTTPFMTGTSHQVDVILSDDDADVGKPLAYLGLQILGWLLAGLFTLGFIIVVRRMNRT